MGNSTETKVVIIGAGVSGLTTGVCLAEAGLNVRVLARDLPTHTTSAVAGASWGPYLVSDPRVLRWSGDTLAILERIAAQDTESGVRLVPGLEAAPHHVDPPTWARDVRGFRSCDSDELPAGYVSGWRYTIPVVDMPTYLAYLERRLAAVGVRVEVATVDSFAEVSHLAPVLVNCTGMGSRDLVPDRDLAPSRGQLVVVENPGIDWFFQDHVETKDLTYFLPHNDHIVLGGCAITGTEHNDADPADAAAIIARCVAVEPLLAEAKVLGHRVGMRPTRPTVRLERVEVDGHVIVHNYGHGGAGVTLSWGCAREVLARIQE